MPHSPVDLKQTQNEVFRRRTSKENSIARHRYRFQTPDIRVETRVLFEILGEKSHVPDVCDFQRHTIAVPYGSFNLQLGKDETMPGTTKYITLEDAKKAMAAAEAEARKNNWNVAIAVLDAGANLILFEKIDETQLGNVNTTIC